jgi:hypothetical protein
MRFINEKYSKLLSVAFFRAYLDTILKASVLASTLQPFSRRTNASKEIKYTSYEIPKMSWKYNGVALSWRGPHPPPLRFMILFLSEVVDALDKIKI